jgi:hypothetical protein
MIVHRYLAFRLVISTDTISTSSCVLMIVAGGILGAFFLLQSIFKIKQRLLRLEQHVKDVESKSP